MADMNSQATVIGADTHIKGDMTFESTARLLGTFEGKITSKGELQVANGATCRASVEANKVMIDGDLEGNLTARERVELTAKAKVKGDMIAARLVVAEGASLVGHLTVGPDAAKTMGTPPPLGEPKSTVVVPRPGEPIPPSQQPPRK
jgi:cytoskeletal protein CcmA (bactofilin family)